MSIYKDKAHGGRFRFSFNRLINGRRVRATKLLPRGWSYAQADALDRAESARLYAKHTGVGPDDALVDDAVAKYLTARVPKLRDGKKAAQCLASMLPWYEGKPLSELSAIFTEYQEDQCGKIAPGTIRNRVAYLHAAVKFAWKSPAKIGGAVDPTARTTIPVVDNNREVFLRPEELKTFLRHVPAGEARALWTLAFYTGLRWLSDLLVRQKADILREGGDVWLDVHRVTKTGRPFMIWIHPAARWALKYLPFAHSRKWHYERFWAARVAAKMSHLRPHDLRHSLASVLLSSGATLSEVGGTLGHKSPQSTERYAHLYPERIKQRLETLPSVREVFKVLSLLNQ